MDFALKLACLRADAMKAAVECLHEDLDASFYYPARAVKLKRNCKNQLPKCMYIASQHAQYSVYGVLDGSTGT